MFQKKIKDFDELENFFRESKNWFNKILITIKEFAQKYKETKEWFSTTLKSIGDAVIATDKKGYIIFMNPMAEKLTEYSENESINQPLEKIFHIINEETRSPVENPVKRVLREGIVVGLANHTILITKSKKELFIADSGAPIRNEDGEIIGVVLIFRDISEQRRSEIKLQEDKEYIESIVETIREPLIVLDDKFRVISANKSFYNKFKLPKEEVENKIIYNIGEGLFDFPKLRSLLEDIIPKNTKFEDFEIEQIFKGIGKRILLVNARRLYYEDRKTRKILMAIEDITERKEAMEKLKKSEKLYRDAYNRAEFYKDIFTHDINNILQNILFSSQLILNQIQKYPSINELIGESLKIIDEQVKRGSKLIENVRKLSAINESDLKLVEINAYEILIKTLNFFKRSYKVHNIELTIKSFLKNIIIKGNEFLEDLFENIILNAIKHNESHVKKVDIIVSQEIKNDINYARFEFRDNGIGIHPRQRKILFENIGIDDVSSKRIGLGLSLVKRIVDSYGGFIDIKDNVEGDYTKGTNFIVYLPQVRL
ncbi:MAG: PAS domain-containing protein [Promethearchaeota archaeon]